MVFVEWWFVARLCIALGMVLAGAFTSKQWQLESIMTAQGCYRVFWGACRNLTPSLEKRFRTGNLRRRKYLFLYEYTSRKSSLYTLIDLWVTELFGRRKIRS